MVVQAAILYKQCDNQNFLRDNTHVNQTVSRVIIISDRPIVNVSH